MNALRTSNVQKQGTPKTMQMKDQKVMPHLLCFTQPHVNKYADVHGCSGLVGGFGGSKGKHGNKGSCPGSSGASFGNHQSSVTAANALWVTNNRRGRPIFPRCGGKSGSVRGLRSRRQAVPAGALFWPGSWPCAGTDRQTVSQSKGQTDDWVAASWVVVWASRPDLAPVLLSLGSLWATISGSVSVFSLFRSHSCMKGHMTVEELLCSV